MDDTQPTTMDDSDAAESAHTPDKGKKRKRTKRAASPWKGKSRPQKLAYPRETGFLISVTVPLKLMAQLEDLVKGWLGKIVQKIPLVESSARKILPLRNMVEQEIISQQDADKVKQIVQKITNSLNLAKLKGSMWRGAQVDDLDFIIAGKVSKNSNNYTPCSVHRDSEWDEEELKRCELLSASVLLDKLTPKNGSVKFWLDSVQFPHSTKHPYRIIGKEPENRTYTWEGDKGTMRVWDSRMLHQSLPNETNETTLKLAWYVLSKRYIANLQKKRREAEAAAL
jgi:hypothetical protein